MKPLLVAFAVLLVPSALFAADPPKPGSAEWKRRFREHERKLQEMRRRSGSTSSTRRGGTKPTALKKLPNAEERLRANMSASEKRLYDAASKPQPFDEKNAPSADKCLLMFRDALRKPEPFSVLIQCLDAEHRKEFVRRRADPNHFKHGQSEQDFMASWRRVVGHVTKIESVRRVSGVEGWVDVWAWVQAPGLSTGLYRFRMAGEGRFYRVREFRADVIRVK